VKEQTRPNRFSESRAHVAEERRSLPEAWGRTAGTLIVVLLVLSVWFGLGVHSSGAGLDVDVPAVPAEGPAPSD
jgi:hypothetical protein